MEAGNSFDFDFGAIWHDEFRNITIPKMQFNSDIESAHDLQVWTMASDSDSVQDVPSSSWYVPLSSRDMPTHPPSLPVMTGQLAVLAQRLGLYQSYSGVFGACPSN